MTTPEQDGPPPYDALQDALDNAVRRGVIEVVGVGEDGQLVYRGTGAAS